MVKNPPANEVTVVQSLAREDATCHGPVAGRGEREERCSGEWVGPFGPLEQE